MLKFIAVLQFGCLLSPVNYFVSSPSSQSAFLVMYDLSACTATGAYDGDLLKDSFSWETGHEEKQAWYIQAVYLWLLWIPKSACWVKNRFFFQNVKGQHFHYCTKEVIETGLKNKIKIHISTINVTLPDISSSHDTCVCSISFSLETPVLTI